MDLRNLFLVCALMNCAVVSQSLQPERSKPPPQSANGFKFHGSGLDNQLNTLLRSILVDPINQLLISAQQKDVHTDDQKKAAAEATEKWDEQDKSSHLNVENVRTNLKRFLTLGQRSVEPNVQVDISRRGLKVSIDKVDSTKQDPEVQGSETSDTFDEYVDDLVKERSKWFFNDKSNKNPDKALVNIDVGGAKSGIDVSLPVLSANIPMIEIPGYRAPDGKNTHYFGGLREWIRSGQILRLRVKPFAEKDSGQLSDDGQQFDSISDKATSPESPDYVMEQNGSPEFFGYEQYGTTEDRETAVLEKKRGYLQSDLDHSTLSDFSGEMSSDQSRKITESPSFADPQEHFSYELLRGDGYTPPEKDVILALTPTGLPLVLSVDRNIDAPILRLHEILLEHKLSAIVPVNPDLSIVGKQFAFLGSNPDLWTGPLYMDIQEISENAHLIREHSELQHRLTAVKYGEVDEVLEITETSKAYPVSQMTETSTEETVGIERKPSEYEEVMFPVPRDN